MAETETNHFNQLPENVQKAVDDLIEFMRPLAASDYKKGNFIEGMDEAGRAAESDPEKFKQFMEPVVGSSPQFVTEAVDQEALSTLESSPPLPQELLDIAGDMAERIRVLASNNYRAGLDKSELAKQAATMKKEDFDCMMRESLLHNPKTIELMRNLPPALKAVTQGQSQSQ